LFEILSSNDESHVFGSNTRGKAQCALLKVRH
jgi:hypothetical protein